MSDIQVFNKLNFVSLFSIGDGALYPDRLKNNRQRYGFLWKHIPFKPPFKSKDT